MNNNLTGIITPSTKLLLTLSMIKGVGPVLLKKAASLFSFSNISSIDELSRTDPKFSSLVNNAENFCWQRKRLKSKLNMLTNILFE